MRYVLLNLTVVSPISAAVPIKSFDDFDWGADAEDIVAERVTPSKALGGFMVYKSAPDIIGGHSVEWVKYLFSQGTCFKDYWGLWSGEYHFESADKKTCQSIKDRVSHKYGDYQLSNEKIKLGNKYHVDLNTNFLQSDGSSISVNARKIFNLDEADIFAIAGIDSLWVTYHSPEYNRLLTSVNAQRGKR